MKRVLFQMWDKSTQVPFLAQMSDGSLIGTFSTVRWGRIEDGRFVETTAWNTKQLEEFFCRSTDGGHTWSLPEPFPYPCRPWHPLGGDEYLGAIGVLSDPDKHRLQDGTASKSVLCLVRGRLKGSRMEWDPPAPIAPIGDAPLNQGRLTRLLDGTLLAYYGVIPPRVGRPYLAVRRSEDNGHSWGDEIVVDPPECGAPGMHKSYLVIVADGDGTVSAFWTEARPQPFLRKSEDGGRTWSERRPINPFRSPKTGRPYSYSKLQGAVSLAVWGGEWYTDVLAHGRATDRRFHDPDDPGGVVAALSHDGGYSWEQTQIIDDCKDAWPQHLAPLLQRTVGGMNTGYGNMIILGNKVYLASPNVDAEALRQKCYLYDIPNLIAPPEQKPASGAEPPGQFGKDAGGR